MRMPWQRGQPTEDRGYTDAVVAAIVTAAGQPVEDASASSGLEIAAGVIARAFASADIVAPPGFDPPDAAAMEAVGRDLIAQGESVLARIEGGWMRASTWDVVGRGGESSWSYQLEFPAPNGNFSRRLRSGSVVHARYSTDANRPWVGVGPLERARLAAKLHSNMELRTGEEAGAHVGHVLPIPTDGKDATVAGLKKDLANLGGKTALVETTSGGWAQGKIAAPGGDWQPRRIGPTFASAIEPMHRTAQLAVVAACGVPIELLTASDGTGQREAWRRCLHGTIAPLGRIVERQLAKVAGQPVEIKWDRLMASDIAGRARAYASLVSAGMTEDDALAASGL